MHMKLQQRLLSTPPDPLPFWRCDSSLSRSTLGCYSPIFSCLVLLCPPLAVSYRIVVARPWEWVMWPYHFSFSCLTIASKSVHGPISFILTSLSVMWSLYVIPRSLWKHLISSVLILCSVSAVRVQDSHTHGKINMTNGWFWSWWGCFYCCILLWV